jgi:DNA modification methylase
MSISILIGDCRERMRELPDNSVDSVVCDPPYELNFMGAAWDRSGIANDVQMWREVLRVLKPGGHLLSFAATRTYHRMTCAIEDAGFQIRDCIFYCYGSGFPKSHDISKAIDKSRTEDLADVEKVRAWLNARRLEAGLTFGEINGKLGRATNGGGRASLWMTNPSNIQMPTLEDWAQLKSIIGFSDEMDAEVRRLNVRKGTAGEAWLSAEVIGEHDRNAQAATWSAKYTGNEYASDKAIKVANSDAAREWEGWGTALKPALEPICLARKPLSEKSIAANVLRWGTGAINVDGCRIEGESTERTNRAEMGYHGGNLAAEYQTGSPLGRWPANLVHDGSDEVVAGFPAESGGARVAGAGSKSGGIWSASAGEPAGPQYADSGSAARFFYCAKATTEERGEGNNHPTVKPIALMQWLVRLVTPVGGTVLDPFMGSGSTGLACQREQFDFIGCEMSPDYAAIAERRMRADAGLFAQVAAA